jgi:hypothetical protein
MDDIKDKLHGGLEEKKRVGAERLKAILEEIKHRGVVSEGELSKASGIDRRLMGKYVEFLREKGLVDVKKRLFKDSEISVAGGIDIHIHSKEEPELTPPEDLEPPVPADAEKKAVPSVSVSASEKDLPAQPAQETPVPEADATTEPKAQQSPTHAIQSKPPHSMAVSGEKVVPGNDEELHEVCKSLVTDFLGIMRLSGESGGQMYSAALLIDRGDIVALSFENLDAAELSFGDDAMHELATKFIGTRGDLEIFELTEDDLNQSLQSNINYLLSKAVKLSSLSIRIKQRPLQATPVKKSLLQGIGGIFGGSGKTPRGKRLDEPKQAKKAAVERIGGVQNLVEFARALKLEPERAKRLDRLRANSTQTAAKAPSMSEPQKALRLQELKKRRQEASLEKPQAAGISQIKAERIDALRGEQHEAKFPGPSSMDLTKEERLDELRQVRKPVPIVLEKPAPDKTPVKTIKEGKKVETTIDRFYETVQQLKHVKINDALAAKLNVTKTQLEEWAMILEEHNLLELKYPTLGEPEVLSLAPEKKNEEANGHKKD